MGFRSSDGLYSHCSREELAGPESTYNANSETWSHRMSGTCLCGRHHGGADLAAYTPPQTNGAAKTNGAASLGEPPQRLVAEYVYQQEGRPERIVVARMGPRKNFPQHWVDAQGVKAHSLKDCPAWLLELLYFAEPSEPFKGTAIYLCEGEKDADNLARAGLPAASNRGGAGKWKDHHTAQIAGKGFTSANVILDRDAKGHAHGEVVKASLEAAGLTVSLFHSATLEVGSDLTDHLEAGHGVGALVPIHDLATFGAHFRPEAPEAPEAPKSPALRFSDVVMKPVEWVWTGKIPKGKVTLLGGDPGVGKTAVSLDICARITRGHPMPDGTACDPGAVLYCSIEDDVDDTLAPRFHAAGVDMAKAFYISEVDGEFLNLTEHEAELEAAIRDTSARLVVIDHLVGLATGIDTNSEPAKVAKVMMSLRAIAGKTGTAFLVLQHLNKSGTGAAMMRGSGSIQIAAAARSGLIIARPGNIHDEEQQNPQLAQYKSSVGKVGRSIEYELVEKIVDNPANPEQRIPTVRVEWLAETDLRADQFNAQTNPHYGEKQPTHKQSQVIEFLKEHLSGAVDHQTGIPGSHIVEVAKKHGIAQAMVYRVKEAAGVQASGQEGKSGPSLWWIPSPGDEGTDW